MPRYSPFIGPVIRILLIYLALAFSGCASGPAHEETQAVDTAISAAGPSDVSQYADELLELSTEAELWVTPTLLYLADYYDGEMPGLEFRFKSRESTIRKLESRMRRDDLDNPRDVNIRDALRYTMRFTDQPAGHHDDSVAAVLALMENTGHQILTVKNYWPRGDDYSGINTTLRAPNGLAWELQFHTLASFDLKMSSHLIYEQVRSPDASIELRRNLYDDVTKQWDAVPVPADILEPGSLHPMEQIILRPRP